MKPLPRREFLKAAGGVAAASALSLARGSDEQTTPPPPKYKRADYSLLTRGGYGVGFHWLPYTWSGKYPKFDWKNDRKQSIRNWHKSIDEFDVKKFVDQVRSTGAGHVLLASAQVYQLLCCPNEVLEKMCPGIVSERDLVMELADGLGQHNIKLLLYYCHAARNEEWCRVSGYREKDRTRYYNSVMAVWAWMGERYRDKLAGWWLDHGKGYRQADRCFGREHGWHKLAQALKAGFPGRLISYNSSVEGITPLTQRQDMWAGELNCINYVPRGTLAGRLPWYSFFDWHSNSHSKISGVWMFHDDPKKVGYGSPSAETIAGFYHRFKAAGGTVAFNLMIDREGNIYDRDLKTMAEVRRCV